MSAVFLFVAVTMTVNVKPVEAVSNGKIAYTVLTTDRWNEGGDIYVMNDDGTGKTQLSNDGRSIYSSFAPNGLSLAFANLNAIGGNPDTISTINVDGTNRFDTDIETDTSNEGAVLKWSKTGSKLVGASQEDDHAFFLMNPDGANRLVISDNASYTQDFNSDDSKVVYMQESEDRESFGVYISSINGSGTQKLNSGDIPFAISPFFSKDETKIYFTGTQDFENLYLYSVNLDGSNQTQRRQLSGLGFIILSLPDNKIAFTSDSAERIYISDINDSSKDNTIEKEDLGMDGIYGLNLSPDGTKFVFSGVKDEQFDVYTVNTDGTGLTNLTNTPDQNERTADNSQAWWGPKPTTSPGTDTDNDGTPDTTEDAAPNNGDANNDGIKDSLQSNVTSLIDPVSGNYAVLAVSEQCSIESLSIAAESANTTADTSYDYPNGMMDFNLNCGTPGFIADISQYYYNQDSSNLTLRKYSPATKAYATIDSASVSNEAIAGLTVAKATYQVKDGSSLDLDNTVDGMIKDPSGLGQPSSLAATGQNQQTALTVALATTGLITLAFVANGTLKRRAYAAAR